MSEPSAAKHLRKVWGFRVAVAAVVLAALAVAAFGWWQFRGAGDQAADQAAAAGDDFLAACPLVTDNTSNLSPTPTLPPPFPAGVAPADGTIIGLLRLSSAATPWPIRAGVGEDNLAAGVGWYPQTAGPGQLGNMALVGYRLSSGGAFDDILGMNVGDEVIVDTCDTRFTYTVEVAPRDLTVQPNDTWVLDAVPGQPGSLPNTAWLTLIANQDILPGSDRAVGFARLTAAGPRP